MKKRVFRLVLALVIMVTMVMSSLSIAEAKGNPHSTVTISPQSTYDGVAYDLSFTLSWEAYRVQRYRYVWYKWMTDHWQLISANIVTLPKAERSYSETIDTADYNPQDVLHGDRYKIRVELFEPYRGDGFAIIYVEEQELPW